MPKTLLGGLWVGAVTGVITAIVMHVSLGDRKQAADFAAVNSRIDAAVARIAAAEKAQAGVRTDLERLLKVSHSHQPAKPVKPAKKERPIKWVF